MACLNVCQKGKDDAGKQRSTHRQSSISTSFSMIQLGSGWGSCAKTIWQFMKEGCSLILRVLSFYMGQE